MSTGRDVAWSRLERAAELHRPSGGRPEECSVVGGNGGRGCAPGSSVELGRSSAKLSAGQSDKSGAELAGEDGSAAELTRRDRERKLTLKDGEAEEGEN